MTRPSLLSQWGVLWVNLSLHLQSCCCPLFLSDPAQALLMPKVTYLPTGMGGLVSCPVRAQPPLLRVDWTRDGVPLDLGMVRTTPL